MRILYISSSDLKGGAARGAFRLHKSFISNGIKSSLLVQDKSSDDHTVIGPNNFLQNSLSLLRPTIAKILLNFLRSKNPNFRSINIFHTGLANRINSMPADIVLLHWFGNETISIAEVGKIKKPIVLRLADMWTFSGAEHYAEIGSERYIYGYTANNRPLYDRGLDIDRWVWRRKYKHWKDKPFTIVTGSAWLADCAKNSKLFMDNRIEIIPTGLDTNIFKPIDKVFSRAALNLPQNKSLILFGALNPDKDDRKGFPALKMALNNLSKKVSRANTEIVIFGSSGFKDQIDLGFNCHFLGILNDDHSLCLAYNSADVMVVPSLQEAFGQTASESLSCGTPAVAFNATGLIDVVEHKVSGYLAEPYKSNDLAEGILWILKYSCKSSQLNINARRRAVNLFDVNKQANQYIKLFNEILRK